MRKHISLIERSACYGFMVALIVVASYLSPWEWWRDLGFVVGFLLVTIVSTEIDGLYRRWRGSNP